MTHIAQIVCPGILPTGEVFDYSFWLAESAGTDLPLSVAQDAANNWNTSLSVNASFRALYSTTTTFSSAKAYIVESTTGKVVQSGVGGSQFTGSAATASFPPQLAVCVTIRTALAGASYRGRFYLPAPLTAEGTTTGRITGAAVTTLVTAMNQAATAITSTDTGVHVGVYSRVHHVFTAGTFFDIGDVFDTQRRRRDKLAESRQTSVIP